MKGLVQEQHNSRNLDFEKMQEKTNQAGIHELTSFGSLSTAVHHNVSVEKQHKWHKEINNINKLNSR